MTKKQIKNKTDKSIPSQLRRGGHPLSQRKEKYKEAGAALLKNKVIMQVLPSLEMGGVERGTIEMATALTARGISNIVVSSGGRMVAELKRLGVEHIQLPVGSKNPFVMWANSKKLAQIIKEKKVDLIHVRSRAPAWPVKWASAKTGVPFITTFHGFYGLKPRWLKMPYNRVMTEGVKIIAVSDFVKNHIIQEYGVDSKKIVRIHRGADLNIFNPERVSVKQVNDFFNKFQIPIGKPIITLAGRFSVWKGHLVLLKALSLMKHREVAALFVGKKGSAQVMDAVRAEMKNLAPETDVVMVEESQDMPTVCAASNIMVSASTEPETFGRVAVEAEAMGRIIVATNIGGSRETVVDGVTGFLVPPNDPAALAAALDQAIEMSPKARAAMEKAAAAHVRKNFSIEVMCEKTIEVYERVLRGK